MTLKQEIDDYIAHLLTETESLMFNLKDLCADSKGKERIYVNSEELTELSQRAKDIFEELSSLNKANEALYENRGKSSSKKILSSKVNGRLGGRPPKDIAEKKKRIRELEYKHLTEAERKEFDDLTYAICAWENSKRGKR